MTAKQVGLLCQLIVYAAAIAIAAATFIHAPESWHFLFRVAAADIAATTGVFICSLALKNSSLYDPYWSVKPGVIAAFYISINPRWTLVATLAGGLLLLYALRLTSNFLRDWPGLQKQDWRYDDIQRKHPRSYWLISYAGIHLFPTVLTFLGCIPAYYLIVASPPVNITILSGVGALVLLTSIVLAFVADEQMRTFRKKRRDDEIMDKGLWHYSRHPNYFGEVLTWWGLWLMALGIDLQYWWTGVGALAITLLFYFISIPLMDNRSAKRRPKFQNYMDKTPALIPWRPRN